jgi:hypothetical protein
MPQLTIKTEYVQKLKELGVYDQWLENVKSQFATTKKTITFNESTFRAMISCSFSWSRSPEGHSFWADISDK